MSLEKQLCQSILRTSRSLTSQRLPALPHPRLASSAYRTAVHHQSRARPIHTTVRRTMPYSQKRLTPADILRRNDTWSQEVQSSHSEMLAFNAAGQSPSILWLGCCDSRVPEGVVSQTKPGDMFVHRNIANQYNETDDSANSALTYGVEALGIEHVIIVGHTSCGGVLASLSGAQGEDLPKSESLLRYLTPLVKLCGTVLEKLTAKAAAEGKSLADDAVKAELLTFATEENVKAQVQNVANSKVVQANWAGKKTAFPGAPTSKVHVHGFIHDIASGRIRDLGVTVTPPQ